MEEELIKALNDLLRNVPSIDYTGRATKVAESYADNLSGEGGFNASVSVYKLGVADYHLKVEMRTDSYGDNESVHSIQIVTPVVKQVTDYEPV